MSKARKHTRKAPITSAQSTGISAGSSSTPSSTRTVIRRFHVLLKRRVQLETSIQAGKTVIGTPAGKEDARKALAEVEKEIEQLGGLEAYQHMSSIGQGHDRGGGSQKVLIDWLKELGLGGGGAGKESKRLRLLEVGALKPDNYASCSTWIDATLIDLRSRHPLIREQDFLDMSEKENHEKWNIISLSLVLNFVPDAKDRGRMLRLAYSMLKPGWLLFLVLPLPCIMNSRYMSTEHIEGLLQCIGFSVTKARWKEGGKMVYWLLRKELSESGGSEQPDQYRKKKVLREGKRNNFTILL